MHELSSSLKDLFRKSPLLLIVLVGFWLASGGAAVLRTVADVRTQRDAGFPDSATLYTTQQFLRTGRLYPDFDAPRWRCLAWEPYWLLS